MGQELALTGAALATFLAAILARASAHKAREFERAVGAALDYEAAPERLVPGIVRGLALLEAAAALALLLPATRAPAGLVAAGLFAGYALLMIRALRAGKTGIDCGCGGAPEPVSRGTVARDLGLAVLALLVAALPGGGLGLGGALLAAAAGLTLFASHALAGKLASHQPQARRAAGAT